LKYLKHITLTLCFLIGYFNLHSKNYYVSTAGTNLNQGSFHSPFLSIQIAINKLKPGDTCFIRGGWYNENLCISKSGTKQLPIVIQAYKNEKVVIKPQPHKYRWIKHDSHIYKTKIKGIATQVFEDDQPQFQAAFPTIREGIMNTSHWGDIYAFHNKKIFFQAAGKWKNLTGAHFNGICGRGLVSLNGKVIKQHDNIIKVQNEAFYWNKQYKNAYLGKGKGFLTGKLSFLDSPGEWFQDNNYFYYWPIKDSNLKKILIRYDKDSIQIFKSKFIKIKNISIFSKSLILTKSTCTTLDKLTILYPTPYYHFNSGFDRFGSMKESNPDSWKGKGVILSGKYNSLINSIVRHSWGDGVTIYGDNNRIYNSSISDCDWMGTDAAVVNASGKNHRIIHCNLYKAGRSVLTHRKLASSTIKYNHIYQGGLLCDDLGLTYTYDTDGENTEIAYNWLHDNKAKHYGSGIYLDNNHKNFKIHHNVIWNCFVGLTINQRAENDLIYNNTFLKNKYTMGCCVPSGEKPEIINIITSNNLTESNLKSRDQQPFYGTVQNNNHFIPHLTSQLVNPYQHEFRVKSKNTKGTVFNNLGAYNTTNYWKAGSTVSLQPTTELPWYQNKSVLSIIQYLLLFSYLVITIKIILYCHTKFRISKKNILILFGIKIISAFAFYILYTYHYTNRDNAELFYYYDDALTIYKEHFHQHPFDYFKFITGFNSYSPEFSDTLSQTIWWKKSLAMDYIHQLEIQTFIKLNNWILLFSFGNIHIHTLFFASVSFISYILLYRCVKILFHGINHRIFLFLSLPSVLLFTSNGIKETILVFFLSTLCSSIFLLKQKGLKYLIILLSIVSILILRSYYLLALIPGVLWILTYKYFKKPLWIYICIHIFFFICLLFNPWLNITENLKNKQADMLLVADEMNVTSRYNLPVIKGNPIELFTHIPDTLFNVFIRFKGDIQEINMFVCIYFLENILLLFLIMLSIIYPRKNSITFKLRLFTYSFCLIVSLFIGSTVPIVGAIIKYKAPMIMILYMTCILLIDWNKIKSKLIF
jgi:hypothetical protein